MIKEKIENILKNVALEYRLDNFIEANRPITDSRKIKPGDIFICITGLSYDGHNFAEAAIEKGAALIISEKSLPFDIPQIIVDNSRRATAILCKEYYNDPSKQLKLIGVTGTNGKTTVTYLFHQILRKMGINAGLIGTLGYKINDTNFNTERTTPDIIQLNEILSKMINADIEYVIMEVSSHAIFLDRIAELSFIAGIFTNLTQDHLDFHKTMENYANTKFSFFNQIKENSGLAIINIDNDYGKKLFAKDHFKKISISQHTADIRITNINSNIFETKFSLVKNDIYQHFKTKLIGDYNIYNLSQTLALIQELFPAFHLSELQNIISSLHSVPGRLQKANSKDEIGVYIDYAHSPDALENVLETLRKITSKRIICVFGAGGERDKSKRPKMFTAAKEADLVIITNDNPRKENPADIIKDIISETKSSDGFWIIRDRKQAIKTAIDLAHKGDIVLIAGKGHEKYQEINEIKYNFDDLEIAENYQPSEYDGLAVPIDTLMLEKIFDCNLKSHSDLIYHISTDSRSIKENALFIALNGEKFDGHNYIDSVLSKKGCFAIVDKKYNLNGDRLIQVDDTTIAYGKLASIYKKLFNLKSIAITGSYGKTTTKEYIFNILNQNHSTLKTFSNENNLIGLPKTIFKLTAKDEYAVFELGSNHFGEIKALSNICQADINVITSIAPVHIEFFGDEMGVFKEKTSIFRGRNEIRLYPGDDLRFRNISGITFGQNADCDYRIQDIKSNETETYFTIENYNYKIITPFSKNAFNALIAVAIASELKFSQEEIAGGLLLPLDISNRMQIYKFSDMVVISDCYNANPSSMKAALIFWYDYLPERKHIAIIGDMLELGKQTDKLHKEIGKILRSYDNVLSYSVGKYSSVFSATQHFSSIDDLIKSKIYQNFPANAVILLKASRSIKLEKILSKLKERGI
jgi:murE/murF fusion protein